MSDIVKSQPQNAGASISKRGTGRKPKPSIEPIQTTTVNPQVDASTDTTLNEAAIAAANLPFIEAQQTFNKQFAVNARTFNNHVRGTTENFAAGYINQLQSLYGLSEDELFESEQSASEASDS